MIKRKMKDNNIYINLTISLENEKVASGLMNTT